MAQSTYPHLPEEAGRAIPTTAPFVCRGAVLGYGEPPRAPRDCGRAGDGHAREGSMSTAKPLWWLSISMMAVLLVLFLVGAPGNMIAGVLMLGCAVVVVTMIAAGLEAPQ